MLKYFEKKFSNYSFRVKIELYLLPILLLYIVYFFQDKYKKVETIVPKTDIKTLINKKFQGSYLELFHRIEKYALKNKINITQLENKSNKIIISIKSSLSKVKKIMFMLENLNNFSKIQSLSLMRIKKSSYLISLVLSMDKYYIKDLKDFEKNNKKPKAIKVLAIIDDFAYIGNKWLKLGDSIDNYQIVEIGINFVKIEDKNGKIKKLRIKNEKFRKYFD